ncbi:hypothetical protein ABEB36_001527 [Hypothenemus hampei]|uniref:Uncharacterized protein n=1 Tax=Hypothenemus hampei TaxID=57062 RepID=A0ABD1FEU9_HYPHA
MNRFQWKSGKTLSIFLLLLFVYLLIRVRTYEYKITQFLPKVHPNEPWEFIADFSNMKSLNPTIKDFTIVAESGNYNHWKYSVDYTENLSHWPYTANHATGHFQVKSGVKDNFYITSVHRTCFLNGLYCLDSESEFKFSKSNSTNGCVCEETVLYECPAFLSSFCKQEVVFQRNAIMKNLHKRFFK